MPCDSIRQTTVDLGKVDPTILTAALNAMGLNAVKSANGYIAFTGGSYHAITGQLTLSGSDVEARTNKIRAGYSAEIVKSQARKYGWQVKTTGTNKFEVIKRTV